MCIRCRDFLEPLGRSSSIIAWSNFESHVLPSMIISNKWTEMARMLVLLKFYLFILSSWINVALVTPLAIAIVVNSGVESNLEPIPSVVVHIDFFEVTADSLLGWINIRFEFEVSVPNLSRIVVGIFDCSDSITLFVGEILWRIFNCLTTCSCPVYSWLGQIEVTMGVDWCGDDGYGCEEFHILFCFLN